jgi:hypothetical protein
MDATVPRFAILEHDRPSLHWDFLLEAGTVLRSWRLLSEPDMEIEAQLEPNADHRLLYLDYEGPIGGDRGTVRRWDAGTFDWIADEVDFVVVELRGSKLLGRCTLDATSFRMG